jgi:hypothetical protein
MFLSDKLDLIYAALAEDPTEDASKEAIKELMYIVNTTLSELITDLKSKNHTDNTAVPIIRANVKRLNITINTANDKNLILGERLLKPNMVLLLCEINGHPKQIYEGL